MTPPVPGPKEGLNAAVAAQIRAEAAAAQLSDKALAAKADVNYASLRRWLGKDAGNERHIDVAVLGALANALGMSAAEIVGRAQARMDFMGAGVPDEDIRISDGGRVVEVPTSDAPGAPRVTLVDDETLSGPLPTLAEKRAARQIPEVANRAARKASKKPTLGDE